MSIVDLKTELINQFSKEKTYLGSHIRTQINDTSFSNFINSSIHNGQVKKGDMFISNRMKKARPAVVISVDNKNQTCKVITVTTSADCIHNTGISHNSRFVEEGFYAYSLNLVTISEVAENFICVIEDKKTLNKAIKVIKDFFVL